MSLDDLFAADAFSQRALDLLHDRDAAEDIDVLHDVDAIAAVVLATLAVAKRLSIVGDQLATLTASIDGFALDAVERDLQREQTERARLEGEIEDLQARVEAAQT